MCNMSKSKRMTRLEYNLCTIKNTNNIVNNMKNDLENGTIHAPPGRMLAFTATDNDEHSIHGKLVAGPWHLVPTIDISPHTSHWTRP